MLVVLVVWLSMIVGIIGFFFFFFFFFFGGGVILWKTILTKFSTITIIMTTAKITVNKEEFLSKKNKESK